jgi:hypothetical protein
MSPATDNVWQTSSVGGYVDDTLIAKGNRNLYLFPETLVWE